MIIKTMAGKIPYVLECELFKRVEIKRAEELLAEYNDFKIYNLAQYQTIFGKTNDHLNLAEVTEQENEVDAKKARDIAEHNAKVATDHFAKLLGSLDFAESSMVGFHIAWYDLQQILLEEYKNKTPATESVMNEIAPRLRTVASIMVFADRITTALERLDADKKIIATMKDGFTLLMKRCQTEQLKLPEFSVTKKQLSKFKKVEDYMEFCEKLFFA